MSEPSERDLEIVDGVERYKRNRAVSLIVNAAIECGCFNFNRLWIQYQDPARFGIAPQDEITRDDMREFCQLIGYSVSGYGDIFCTDDD